MKTRKGFVSNSSSSSYIISAEKASKYRISTIKVLKSFLKVNQKEIEKHITCPANPYQEVFLWIENNKKANKSPIFRFQSINYDTYIWKRKDGSIQINTCCNIDWRPALDELDIQDYGYGADAGEWQDMPMAVQVSEYDATYKYQYPDQSKVIFIEVDSKYDDLPVLYQPNNKIMCRFRALLEE